ncbi:SDR family NAD(P)-dependent oxidoreductase [Nisaea acidiphila]|uniref:SDR family NAD(P)-dependent oxidoreductase n=1 Tax=Nisaea acidiphila TaxID=1862145 RepID=A0A9J7AR44_9PROT|nr:SDR family NAD(P)-dependent oxidoreductase [Nisaea acidiphila]UUX49662.1 SDR family NAD(P)-dependent oxidoreductase [Nisaea acidiphila]
MRSFESGTDAVVIGATGGIGGAMVEALAKAPQVGRIIACGRTAYCGSAPRTAAIGLDIGNEESISAAARRIGEETDKLRLVIVATGMLHSQEGVFPEKSWRDLDPGTLETVFRINAVGPALVAKHFLPMLPRTGKSVFAALSARVGSISDNRLGGWHAYRASKAALNMLIRNFAIELARKAPEAACVGLHPGTVETELSEPFRSGLPAGQLVSPEHAAGRLLEVIDKIGAEDSGGVFAWDGARIPE